ncbi:MAG: hypothetical protein R3B47_15865 [Bacteroidia bacterium]
MRYILVVVSLLIIASACNRVKDVIPPHTDTIFPLEVGKSWTYLVIDTTWAVGNPPRSIVDVYYKRETITGTETDLLGREVYRLETFRTADTLNGMSDFEPMRAGYLYRGNEYGERFMNNKRRLVLKWPVYNDIQWNGNLYVGNPEHNEQYRYRNIDTTVTVLGTNYAQSVWVAHSLPSDAISQIKNRVAYEVYSAEKGRILSYDRTFVMDQSDPTPFNPDDSYTHIEMLIE